MLFLKNIYKLELLFLYGFLKNNILLEQLWTVLIWLIAYYVIMKNIICLLLGYVILLINKYNC